MPSQKGLWSLLLLLSLVSASLSQSDEDVSEDEDAETSSEEDSEEAKRVRLETFTYPDAKYEAKLAAFKRGLAISKSVLDELLPEYNETRLIEEDKRRNWRYYQFIPGYEQQAREGFRQAYVMRKLTLRRDNMPALSRECPRQCADYVRSNFSAPDVGNDSDTAELLQDSGMASFAANFVSLPLEEMYAVQDENCNQWEAKWQCLYGCFQNKAVIEGMKRQLTGDEHLSVNIECPDSRFLINLPCLKDNIEEVAEKCSKPFAMYRARRETAINETAEIIEDLQADGAYKDGLARAMGVSPRYLATMEVRDKQRSMCNLFFSYLSCAIRGFKAACNERSASFFHTSVVANFLERVLPERVSVERIIGTIPLACEYLVQKRAFGLLPIEYQTD